MKLTRTFDFLSADLDKLTEAFKSGDFSESYCYECAVESNIAAALENLNDKTFKYITDYETLFQYCKFYGYAQKDAYFDDPMDAELALYGNSQLLDDALQHDDHNYKGSYICFHYDDLIRQHLFETIFPELMAQYVCLASTPNELEIARIYLSEINPRFKESAIPYDYESAVKQDIVAALDNLGASDLSPLIDHDLASYCLDYGASKAGLYYSEPMDAIMALYGNSGLLKQTLMELGLDDLPMFDPIFFDDYIRRSLFDTVYPNVMTEYVGKASTPVQKKVAELYMNGY